MANNEQKIVSAESTQVAAEDTVRDLIASVENLPKTDHMTLPAVMITEIDEETLLRMRAIAEINAAKSPSDVIEATGKTLQEIRNEFQFGVADLSSEGEKHSFKTFVDEKGRVGVTITPPAVNGEQQEPLTVVATPANIAPVDADAPHNPVEAKEAGEAVKPAPVAPFAPIGVTPTTGLASQDAIASPSNTTTTASSTPVKSGDKS